MYSAVHELKAPFLVTLIQTLTKLHNVDFKIIMYGAVHELKAPFLVTLIQTLTKFAMGQSGSCPDVHRLNAHRFTIA